MATSHLVEYPAELLAFLIAMRPAENRAKVRQRLKYGSVQVNGRSITRFNHPLQAGDVVSIRTKDEVHAEGRLPAGLKVMFEDASLIVIEKPAGLLSMANETQRQRTAYAFLTDYVRRGNPRSPERVWIVHRLDRETSGVMVFAKSEAAKRALQAGWGKVDKRYLAVVEGCPPADVGVLQSHLDESRPFKVYSAAANQVTRHAVTHYRVIKRDAIRALVELHPETGRRHQIRVHLADAGCAIVGDQKYGARTNPAGRLGLHASSLQFAHPSSGEVVRFVLPLPRELAGLV